MAAGKEVVEIIRKPKVDKLKPTSGAEQRFDIPRCHVIPRASRENEGGWVQINGFTVVAPGEADIREDDQMVVRGKTYSVLGKPGVFYKGSRPKNTIATVGQSAKPATP